MIQNLCNSVLCGSFILLKKIQEMEKKPEVREIRSYFELMEQKLQGLEAKKAKILTTASTLLKDFCAKYLSRTY